MKSETRRKLSVFVFMFLFVGAILAYAETLSPTLLDFPSGTLNIDTINLGGVSRDTWPAGEAGAIHDQDLNTTDDVTFASLDTGQGANELYDMDQNLLTTSNPTFDEITATGLTTDWIDLDGDLRNTWPTGNGSGRNTTGSYDFIVYREGSTYIAEYANGTKLCTVSGLYNMDEAANYAIGNMSDPTVNRGKEKLLLRGNLGMNNPILHMNHTEIELIGKVTLESGSDCHMVEFRDITTKEVLDWSIHGGLWDGKKSGQTKTNLCGVYFAPMKSLSGAGADGKPMKIFDMQFNDISGPAIRIGNITAGTKTVEGLGIKDVSMSGCRQAIDIYQFHGGNYIKDSVLQDISGPTLKARSSANWKLENNYFAGTGTRNMIATGCAEIQSDHNFFDCGDNEAILLEGCSKGIWTNTYVRVGFGATVPADTPAILLTDGAGWTSSNNTFNGVEARAAGGPSWAWVIKEANGDQDYNSYASINGANCTDAALSLLGIHDKVDFDTITASRETGIALDVPDDFINARSISVPFVIGTTSSTHANIAGWNITSSGNTAFTSITLPSGISEVLRITVYAVSWTAETHSMRLEFRAWGSQSSEIYAAEAFVVENEPSITATIATYDRTSWLFTSGDDEDMDDWLSYETIHVMVRHEAAGGDDCETKGVFQTVLFEYV